MYVKSGYDSGCRSVVREAWPRAPRGHCAFLFKVRRKNIVFSTSSHYTKTALWTNGTIESNSVQFFFLLGPS